MVIKGLLRQPLFIIGFLFILILITTSIIYSLLYHGHVPQYAILTEKGKYMGSPPFKPSVIPPFGTDKNGYNMFDMIIKGAKYTIGMAILVAILRTVLATIIGVFYGSFLRKIHNVATKLFDAFNYVPIILILMFMLYPILMMDGQSEHYKYHLITRLGFEVGALVLLSLPTLALKIGNETMLILEKEFITSSKVIGAGRLYILKKHVFPHLLPKLWVQFVQNIIQVLFILVHMGLFNLFVGGTHAVFTGTGTELKSSSGEWAGLIGENYKLLSLTPWVPMEPLIMFALTIWAFNFIVEGIKKAIDHPYMKIKENIPKENQMTEKKSKSLASFEFLNKKPSSRNLVQSK